MIQGDLIIQGSLRGIMRYKGPQYYRVSHYLVNSTIQGASIFRNRDTG